MNFSNTHVALSKQQSLQILMKNTRESIYDAHYDGNNLYVLTTFSFSDYIKNDHLNQQFPIPPAKNNHRPKRTKSRAAPKEPIAHTILDDECFSDFVILEHKEFQN